MSCDKRRPLGGFRGKGLGFIGSKGLGLGFRVQGLRSRALGVRV